MAMIGIIVFAIATVVTIAGHPTDDPKILSRSDRRPRSLTTTGNVPVPQCEGSTFCTDAADYPTALVDTLMSLNESLKYLATVDKDPPRFVPRMKDDDDNADEQPLCESTELLILPKAGENFDRKWLYVVNGEITKQQIRVEICSSPDTSCQVIDGFADGWTSTCRQVFNYRQVLVVSASGKIVQDFLKFPSACKCFVKFVGSPLMRFGYGSTRKDQSKLVSKIRPKRGST